MAEDEIGRMAFYSAAEVAKHNVEADCWVSLFGFVYDLTSVLSERKGILAQPLIKFAGEDVSHWFDSETREPKTRTCPSTGERVPFTPYGAFIDHDRKGAPWWQNKSLIKGRLSQRQRTIRVVNMLTNQEDTIQVCAEETLEQIQERFLVYNAHSKSYTWKRMGRPLNMKLTLDQNGIPDESAEFEHLMMDKDAYVPAIHIYFNDDLTVR